jgi:serine/threonine protein kinase
MNTGTRESFADEHPLLGRTLRGTYRITRLLDRGGMGLVFEAEHLRLKSRVAVKVLPHHLARDQYALARFRHEAEIVAQLTHPHIVQVVDFDMTDDEQPYLVMELLAGESLATRLERVRALPLDVAVRIAVQTAAALGAVHGAAIVHRDLKPANMFLAEMPGEGVWVKLLDFGISKRPHSGQGLTGEHDVMGTPDYMSPELALGKAASADHRSDQYSLAVIVYEMLSGRVPFLGTSEAQILSQVIADPAPKLSLLVPGLPERVSSVVARAMSKLPEQRFETIDALAGALAHAAGVSLLPGLAATAATLRLTSDPTVLTPESKRAAGEMPPPVAKRQRGDRTNSGLRQRTPPRKAPTARGLPPLDRLHSLLGRVERMYAKGEILQAAELVELALATAEHMPTEQTQPALATTRKLLIEVLEARVGDLGRRLRGSPPPSGQLHNLSPHEAFLLSNANERFTVEELIDSSPLGRLETLRLIARLLNGGWLG